MSQNPEGLILKKANVPEHSITLREAFWVWVKVAVYSFGGPAGQIAVMHRLLVEEKRWISESRFLHALNYCMLLPSLEAQQLATFIGWLMHKTLGGLMAGILFVLPGVVSILALSILYAGFHDTSFVQALFFGLKPAVMAVVVEAVIRIGRQALKNKIMLSLAVLAFISIFFFEVPFPLIILSAGVIGYVGGRLWMEKFYVIKGHELKQGSDKSSEGNVTIADASVAAPHTQPSLARALRVLIICLLLWFVPLFVLAGVFGMTSVYVTEGIFFSKTAVVTFRELMQCWLT
jgi:chromate transporter